MVQSCTDAMVQGSGVVWCSGAIVQASGVVLCNVGSSVVQFGVVQW